MFNLKTDGPWPKRMADLQIPAHIKQPWSSRNLTVRWSSRWKNELALQELGILYFLSKAQRAALGHLRSLEKHGDIRALSGTTITQRVLLASKEKPWMKCYFHFNRQAAKYLFGIFTWVEKLLLCVVLLVPIPYGLRECVMLRIMIQALPIFPFRPTTRMYHLILSLAMQRAKYM